MINSDNSSNSLQQQSPVETNNLQFIAPQSFSGSSTDSINETQPRNKLFIAILISLLFITISVAAHFGQQNQFFKSQLSRLTSKPSDHLATCVNNGQTLQVGEEFQSADGCNSCACEEDGRVACTEIACSKDTEQSQVSSNADWLTYQDESFSFKYPAGLHALRDPDNRNDNVYSHVILLANEEAAREYLDCSKNAKNNLELDLEFSCDIGRVVYSIISTTTPESSGSISGRYENLRESNIQIYKFTDELQRAWTIEEAILGLGDSTYTQADTFINDNYFWIEIRAHSRGLEVFYDQDMMLQDGDYYDATPMIDHLNSFIRQILPTIQFS
jgi:hypothetical protein